MSQSYEPARAAARRGAPSEQPGRTRVLIADSDAAARTLCAGYCDLFDFDCAVAGRRAEAYALMRGERFDVVLMDVGMAGGALLRPALAPIIGLAPIARASEAQRWLAAGFADILAKPVTAARLFAALQAAVAAEADAARSWAPAG